MPSTPARSSTGKSVAHISSSSSSTQYGTGKESFDNLGDCVVTLLQVQADHEQQMKGIRSGMTRLDIADDGYDGPLVI